MDNKKLWDSFLEKIKTQISPMSFETWFVNTELYELKDNTAKVIVPYMVTKKSLKENYNSLIIDTFNEITGSNFRFEYLLMEEIEKNIELEPKGVPSNANFENNLNSNYTFDNFIVGESNRLAKVSAFAVAEHPGTMYNPLFLYSSSGLGKTHLMHAIGNYIVQNSNKKVLYVTCEQFVEDFIGISRKKNKNNNFDSVDIFKKKYRDIDVLIIDDIQYLGSANQTQQEFFNTFNVLHDNNKQIIISSDRSPEDLKLLEERLRTRFTWGLNIDIFPPDFELRMKIIDNKIQGHMINGEFPKDVKEYIASICTSDIRKLEGTITRVVAYAAMMNYGNISLDLAREALKDHLKSSIMSKNKIQLIQQVVAEYYNITLDEIKGTKRNASINTPRQIAMYICRTKYEQPLSKIGIEFGGKTHTTVMHSVDKIKKQILKDANLELEINKIIKNIE